MLCCRRKPEEEIYEHDAILLPQLFHAEVLFRAHDDQGHQGIDEVVSRIRQRFIWRGMNNAVKKRVKVCRTCQNAKTPIGGKKFPLKNIVSGSFIEIVQIDHQKICQTKSGYTGILVMIDHFTKFVEVAPCREFTAEETCQHLMNYWIARHGVPTFVQSDNGIQFAANMTQEFLASAKAVQVFSNTYKPRCNGLVERQNRTLAHMLRVFCSRHMDDWDKHLRPSCRSLQQYAARDHGCFSLHVVDGTREINAISIFLPSVREREDITFSVCQEHDKKTTAIE